MPLSPQALSLYAKSDFLSQLANQVSIFWCVEINNEMGQVSASYDRRFAALTEHFADVVWDELVFHQTADRRLRQVARMRIV